MEKAIKNDSGKIRMDLIPVDALREVAKGFTVGAVKYGDYNYLKGSGLKVSQLIAAAERHIMAFRQGEDFDKDVLVSVGEGEQERVYHLSEAICNLMIIMEYYKKKPQADDRQLSYLKKPKIVLDIDEVVADFLGAYSKKFNVKINNYWMLNYKIGDHLKELENDKEFWMSIPKLRDVPFEPLAYVSSRSIPKEWVEEWIEANGLPCAPVHLVPWGASKVETLLKLGDPNDIVFVDDKYDNFLEVTKAGIFCYLMDAPHNAKYDVGFRKIYSLNEIK